MARGWLTQLLIPTPYSRYLSGQSPFIIFPSEGTTIPKDVAAFLVSKLGADIFHIVSTLTGAFLLGG